MNHANENCKTKEHLEGMRGLSETWICDVAPAWSPALLACTLMDVQARAR